MLGAERLAVGIVQRERIEGIFDHVSADADEGPRGTIRVFRAITAHVIGQPPLVDHLAEAFHLGCHGRLALAHTLLEGRNHIGTESFGGEWRVRRDAQRAQLLKHRSIFGIGRVRHQEAIEVAEELPGIERHHLLVDEGLAIGPFLQGYAGRGRVRLAPGGQRYQLVLVLQCVDGGVVVGARAVGAATDAAEVGRRAQQLHSLWYGPLPVRSRDKKDVWVVSTVRPGAGYRRHAIPGVDDLHHPVAVPHGRHGKHQRLGLEIDPGERVEIVHVKPDNRAVRCVDEPSVVNKLVDRCPGFPRLCCIGAVIDLLLEHHQWQTEQPGFPGKGFCDVRRERVLRTGIRTQGDCHCERHGERPP